MNKYLLVLFLSTIILYFYLNQNKEEFKADINYDMRNKIKNLQNQENNIKLKIGKFITWQGNQLPLKTKKKRVNGDLYGSAGPSINGINHHLIPKSMSVFSQNKCSINCCGQNPYTCSGGCICQTKKQNEFLSSRGHNSNFKESY